MEKGMSVPEVGRVVSDGNAYINWDGFLNRVGLGSANSYIRMSFCCQTSIMDSWWVVGE